MERMQDTRNETGTETARAGGSRRVRKALAGLALAAAMTGPVAVASAAPASAKGCSSCYYGQDLNHNESTLTDRR